MNHLSAIGFYHKESGMSYPSCLDDANHWWYDASDLTTVTKDGSDLVSVWAAKGGAATGKNLLQANGSYQPLWVIGGTIRFDGIDNFLKSAAFTWNQPIFIYLIWKQITWTDDDRIFSGNINYPYFRQEGSPPNLRVHAGTLKNFNGPTLDTWSIIRILFNGSSSKIVIDNNAPVTGNFGNENAGGLNLASWGTSAYANIEVHTIVCANIDDAANEAEIYNWLVTRIP